MRMAFKNIVKPPKTFKFIADGYPAYPLVAQQFALNKDNPLNFDITYQHIYTIRTYFTLYYFYSFPPA